MFIFSNIEEVERFLGTTFLDRQVEWDASKAIQYCSIKEAADIFGVTEMSIHNRLAKGNGAAAMYNGEDTACVRKVKYDETLEGQQDFLRD